VDYGRRSLVETAMFRYKTLIGPTLRARTLTAQKTEAGVAYSVLGFNKETKQAPNLSLIWIYAPTPSYFDHLMAGALCFRGR
jgi:hypothetical protein